MVHAHKLGSKAYPRLRDRKIQFFFLSFIALLSKMGNAVAAEIFQKRWKKRAITTKYTKMAKWYPQHVDRVDSHRMKKMNDGGVVVVLISFHRNQKFKVLIGIHD